MSKWTLFSNHGHVLVCLARDSEARLRDVAMDVGITERAVQKIVRDLQDGGMVSITKNGRRNRYRIHKSQPLRHRLESDCTVNDLIKIVKKGGARADRRADGVESEKAPRKEPQPVSESPMPAPGKDTRSKHGQSAPGGPEPKPAGEARKKPAKPEATGDDDRQQGSLF